MANRTAQEKEKINKYAREGKIRTNKNWFKIAPMTVKKTDPILIEGIHIDYADNGQLLGLTVGKTDIDKHLSDIIRKGKIALTELYRLRNLPTKNKLHLIKASVIPISSYLSSPPFTISTAKMNKLQTIQNKALRYALNGRYPYVRNTRTLHESQNWRQLTMHYIRKLERYLQN